MCFDERVGVGERVGAGQHRLLDGAVVATDGRRSGGGARRACARPLPVPSSKRLHESAYCATRRSVLRSPLPPIITGGRGWVIGRRLADRLGQLVVLALERAVVVAPHLEADLQRLLEPFEALGGRRERDAEAPCSRSYQAAPMPSSPRPPDSTSRVATVFASRPGMAIRHAGHEQARASSST